MLFSKEKDNPWFGILSFGHWDFFVIWFLVLGTFYIQRRLYSKLSISACIKNLVARN
jgi:hypothetical protein